MGTLTKSTPIANRLGLNISICDANDINTVYQTIDFANISNIQIEGDTAFATGGQAHIKKVGFYDKLVGEFTIRTQILTQNLMMLMTGGDAVWDGHSPIVFKNHLLDNTHIFAIKGETMWHDRHGNVYVENIILHRVRPRIAYKRSFSKEGDVPTVDIVFDMMQDEDGRVYTRNGEGYTLTDFEGYTLLDSEGYTLTVAQ